MLIAWRGPRFVWLIEANPNQFEVLQVMSRGTHERSPMEDLRGKQSQAEVAWSERRRRAAMSMLVADLMASCKPAG